MASPPSRRMSRASGSPAAGRRTASRRTRVVYLPRCVDNTLYVGETSYIPLAASNITRRTGGRYTAARRPVRPGRRRRTATAPIATSRARGRCPASRAAARPSPRRRRCVYPLAGPLTAIRLSFQLAFGEPKGSLMASPPSRRNVPGERFASRRPANCESRDGCGLTATMASSSSDALRLFAPLRRQQPVCRRNVRPPAPRATSQRRTGRQLHRHEATGTHRSR